MLRFLSALAALLACAQAAEARCKVTKVETDIAAIRLGDEESVARVLGKLETLPIGANEKPADRDSPSLVLYNRDKTEQAVLTQYPGDVRGSFSVIEVRPAGRAALVGKTLDKERLSTERGIALGVSESFVTDLLGDCYSRKVTPSGETTIEYDLEDMNHSFLKRVKMPNYFGRYKFRTGKLVSYEIGSDYP